MGENQLKGRKEFGGFMPSKLSVYGIVSIIPGPMVSQNTMVEENWWSGGRGQGEVPGTRYTLQTHSPPVAQSL